MGVESKPKVIKRKERDNRPIPDRSSASGCRPMAFYPSVFANDRMLISMSGMSRSWSRHSRMVAPVVIMSSTSTICFPSSPSAEMSENVPRTFSCLSIAVRRVWLRLNDLRASRLSHISIWNTDAMPAHSSRLWL